MTTFLLIRHGQTAWNLEGRYTGQSDVSLNETGRNQARQLAAQLRNNPPDVIYASDLVRARETAEIIAASLALPVHADPRLREVDQGEWEGMVFADIIARYEREFAARKADPLNVAPPGGETVGQVHARVQAAVHDLVARHPGRRVALVAHGMVLALIRLQAYGYPIERVWELVPPNVQVEEVEIREGRSG
ncbi:MAG: histidine phosphatase family protein [Chloroflexi bacterium]|nr:histidine phosphatase family protein [Chloroflexota bacterium]MCI0580446.1 histidine phosphatase family protein [Chloroflexota bacterium]MCI0649190.1 histidine phosphatase family protein [Chloroflexota bacterium]MCI0727998.1 histidine phosphatase family protein [Chloroflexota bacterium]